MIRTLTLLATLVASTAAHATTTPCFRGTGGEALRGLRVTYAPNLWTVYELETNSAGCVDVPTAWGISQATIDVHAANRVVQMVNAGLPIVDRRTVSHGTTYTLSSDHTVAERLRSFYEEGIRGYGPFTGASPVGGSLASGPYISADLGSPLVVSLPYVEPAPLWGIPPRIHLRPTDTSGSTLAHELAHALHIAQWPAHLKAELETYYIGWLLGPNNTHSWSAPSTDVVAYVEAFGGVGSTFAAIGTGDEAAFLAEASDRTDDLREAAPGDPTIEGVVFGILFHELASVVGLDYVVDTYISCEVLTLDAYATCIHDLEGGSSSTFGALREAGQVYGVSFSVAPQLGDADYCGGGYLCGIGEGDCDATSECSAGLECFHDVGSAYGFTSLTDVCELPEGHSGKCTPDHPCREGSGDCDTNADCMGGLSCVHDVGASYGLASWVDVCGWARLPVLLP